MPAIPLTQDEAKLLRRALIIATEDGSIYNDVEDQGDGALKKRSREIEALVAKLNALR